MTPPYRTLTEEKQIRTLGQNPPSDVTVASTFDNDGFRRTLQHASVGGSPVLVESFTPDALGRIREISVPDALTTTYQYRGAGRRLQRDTMVTGGLTLQQVASYDSLGRMTGLHYTKAAEPPVAVAGFERGFDKSGKPLFERWTHKPEGALNPDFARVGFAVT